MLDDIVFCEFAKNRSHCGRNNFGIVVFQRSKLASRMFDKVLPWSYTYQDSHWSCLTCLVFKYAATSSRSWAASNGPAIYSFFTSNKSVLMERNT